MRPDMAAPPEEGALAVKVGQAKVNGLQPCE